MWCLLVVLHVIHIAVGHATDGALLCPYYDCNGITQEDTCFQTANNKSYCLCTLHNVCRHVFAECDNMTDDVTSNEPIDAPAGSNALVYNSSSICFVHDSCPGDFTGNNTRSLCETTTTNLFVDGDMFPVQVKEKGFPNLNFKNKHCAICNGKANYTSWKVAVDLGTCDLFSIETHLSSSDPDTVWMALALTPGCQVYPVELDQACAICGYPDNVFFLDGFPLLSALFNFSPTKELRTANKSTGSSCVNNKISSNAPKTTGVCGFGEMYVAGAGVCQRVLSLIQGTYDFRFYKQMSRQVTDDQARELAKTYIAFLQNVNTHNRDTDEKLIKKWDVKIDSGQTVTGDHCVELELALIVKVDDMDVDEATVRDSLVPCLGHQSSYICFVPADSPQRDTFCQLSRCNTLDTNAQSKGLEWKVQSVITFVSLLLSVVALLLSVFIFLRCPLFHNLPSRINLCLMLSILCAQLLYLSSMLFHTIPLACLVVGVITHYMWLCSFTWMSICAFHTWFTFGRRNISDSMHVSDETSCLKRYCLVAIVFPLLAVLPCLTTDLLTPGFTMGYGKGICFITDPVGITVGFASPVAFTLLMNLILFIATVVNIQRGPKIVNDVRSSHAFFFIYTKLSSLMGFTWICAYIAELVGVGWLDTLSTIVNGLQGVFICISFVCNKRVYKWIHRCVYHVPDSIQHNDINYF